MNKSYIKGMLNLCGCPFQTEKTCTKPWFPLELILPEISVWVPTLSTLDNSNCSFVKELLSVLNSLLRYPAKTLLKDNSHLTSDCVEGRGWAVGRAVLCVKLQQAHAFKGSAFISKLKLAAIYVDFFSG